MRKISLFLALFFTAAMANASVKTIQVTLGSTATQVSTVSQQCKWIAFQNNNASDVVRVGDSTVSSTNGIVLAGGSPGGSFTTPVAYNSTTYNLNTWYLFGTSGDKVDIVCDAVI